MKKEQIEKTIEKAFRKKVQKDRAVQNGYLLVHSEKAGIDISIAEGQTDRTPADPLQPNYMASVGKLFTATIIGILVDQGKLSFDDKITEYLDDELVRKLHIYKGEDYSDRIKIKHLLNQTSGIGDHFRPLLDELLKDREMNFSPREAIFYTKNNTKAHFPPGEGFKYSDTNYHLLGLIIERVTGEPFHAALKNLIILPLDMKHSSMLHYSEPMEKSPFPTADFSYRQIRLNDLKGYAAIDYAGGGVVSTMEDLLKFMKALVNGEILSEKTLEEMKNSSAKFRTGIDYGYGIWKITTVPVVMPKKFNCWGVAGATGSFMFYHPESEAYIIGNFNDFSYEQKGVRFMLLDVIKELSKVKDY